jgi:hypothetical protein
MNKNNRHLKMEEKRLKIISGYLFDDVESLKDQFISF